MMFLFGKGNLQLRRGCRSLAILTVTAFKIGGTPTSGVRLPRLNLFDAFSSIGTKGIVTHKHWRGGGSRKAGFGIGSFALVDLKGTRLGNRRTIALILTKSPIGQSRAQACAFGPIKAGDNPIRTCFIGKGTIGTGKAWIAIAFSIVSARSIRFTRYGAICAPLDGPTRRRYQDSYPN